MDTHADAQNVWLAHWDDDLSKQTLNGLADLWISTPCSSPSWSKFQASKCTKKSVAIVANMTSLWNLFLQQCWFRLLRSWHSWCHPCEEWTCVVIAHDHHQTKMKPHSLCSLLNKRCDWKQLWFASIFFLSVNKVQTTPFDFWKIGPQHWQNECKFVNINFSQQLVANPSSLLVLS